MTRAKPFDEHKKRGPKPKPPMFTFAEATTLVERYVAGETYADFGAEYGVSTGKIQRELNKGYYAILEEMHPGEGIRRRKADTHTHWVAICAVRDQKAS
jgi:hypothetical protein